MSTAPKVKPGTARAMGIRKGHPPQHQMLLLLSPDVSPEDVVRLVQETEAGGMLARPLIAAKVPEPTFAQRWVPYSLRRRVALWRSR